MPKKKLILHIGLQKTGTSSVQLMLNGAASALAENGFYYPDLPVSTCAGPTWRSPFRHNIVAGTYADFPTAFETMDDGQQDEFWSSLETSELNPIISAEDFSRQLNHTPLADRMRAFDVDLIVYLRRQDQLAESLYNQRNKLLIQNCSERVLDENILTEMSLFQFLKTERYVPVLNYRRLIETFIGQFRPAKVLVRAFNRKTLAGGDVRRDFCDLIGIKVSEKVFQSATANESIDNGEISKIIDALKADGPERAREVMTGISKAMSDGEVLAGDYKLLSGPSRKRMLSQYTPINKYVEDKFGILIA